MTVVRFCLIYFCLKLPNDSPIGRLLSTSVVEQMSKGQCKDLVNVYSGLFKLHTCNIIKPIYVNKLLNFAKNLDDEVNMASKVRIIISLIELIDSLRKDFDKNSLLGI